MSKAKRRIIQNAKRRRDEKDGIVTVKAPISIDVENTVGTQFASEIVISGVKTDAGHKAIVKRVEVMKTAGRRDSLIEI